MIRNDTDLPYINDILMVHRATNIVYRRGPAHKAQLVVPSAPPPKPQSAVIRTVRPTRPSLGAALNLRVRYRGSESTDNEAGWCLQRQHQFRHEGDRSGDRSRRATDFNDRASEDAPYENDNGKDVAPSGVRIHEGLCAADFDNSEDEDFLCDDSDIRGLNLKVETRWINCKGEPENPPGHRLTMIQLHIQENVLRDIVEQALKARRNGRIDSSVFSEETPEEEDEVLETILELMELGQSMIDAGAFQGEEGGDIQMMVRNDFHTLMRKATRPFRPTGIRIVKAELSSCLEAFRQLRLKLLQENAGMSITEILEERSLDLRPR